MKFSTLQNVFDSIRNFAVGYVFYSVLKPSIEKLGGTSVITNLLSRVNLPKNSKLQFFGSKQFDKFQGLSRYDSSDSLTLNTIKEVIYSTYSINREYLMVNDNVQTLLYCIAYKGSTEVNFFSYYQYCILKCSKAIKKEIKNSEDSEVYIDKLHNISETLQPLYSELGYCSLGYYTLLCNGASLGGIYTSRIYYDAIQIAKSITYDNPILVFDYKAKSKLFPKLEKIDLVIFEVVSLLLPNKLKNVFDITMKEWYELNSKGGKTIATQEVIDQLYLTILNLLGIENGSRL